MVETRSRLHNFSQQTIVQFLNSIDVRPECERPEIGHFHNLLCVPPLNALYDLDGLRVEATAPVYLPERPHVRENWRARALRKLATQTPEVIEPPPDPIVIDEPLLYIGWLPYHFGHFLLEGMARLYHLPARGGRRLLATFGHDHEITLALPVVSASLQALGIRNDDMLLLDRPALLRHVEVPFPAICHAYEAYHALAEPHTRVAEQMRIDAPEYGRPIYLTRSKYTGNPRRIVREDRLEQALVARGFLVVSPELLPLDRQIALFNTSPLIVGARGSALHTCLFEIGDRVGDRVILCDEKQEGRFLMIDEIKSRHHTAHYLNVMSEDRDASVGADKLMQIDVDLTLNILRGESLI